MRRRDTGHAPLAEYQAKRDFQRTREPAGKVEASSAGNLFVVQKHDASRLHWDFRLEAGGVLKSWAVTKGPTADPDIKRLAVRTEDHPLSYGHFEGSIPRGEYGGGTVMLWDEGTWEPVEGKSAKGIERGHLHFRLHGKRMKGEWLLVRMKPRPGEKRENWLLRKMQDEFASPGDELVEKALTSVLTGRTMAEIAADREGVRSLKGKKAGAFTAAMADAASHNSGLKRSQNSGPKPGRAAKAAKPPAFQPVQLATLVDDVPTGNGWMHEIKFDGYRAMLAVNGGEVRVYTRNGLDWTDRFRPLARAIAQLNLPPCLIDGEIVATDKAGNPNFSALQAVLKRGHGAQEETDGLSFHAFDLLSLSGQDLKPLGNIERKERLEALLADARPPVYLAEHVIGSGEKLFAAMCGAGQEGVISKRVDAPYAGRRTRNWLKVKCVARQEFVILGWTRSSARGRPFASLLLGQHEGGKLVYKGKVGTGFDAALLEELRAAMQALETDDAPAEVPRAEARGATWLKPKLVCEVAFAEFTAEGRVRHASFVGLRADKPARKVKPEIAAPAPVEPGVTISSRDRVVDPASGLTKGDLADYYTALAASALPFLAGRPISLVRCPQGRAKQCFFQKHDSGGFGGHVHHMPIVGKDGGVEDYLYVDSPAGLLACVQMNTIEFHTWGCRASDVEKPDRMIFDLDPDEGLGFPQVKTAADDLRARLADIGLVSFAMLSGGKGVHVVVPLTPGHGWEAHKDFARRFAEALSVAEPERFVATMSKAKRKGRIFIDWLRNQRGSTAVAPYSARARPGLPVATPIAWNELKDMENAHPFNISDTAKLVERATSKALTGWGFAAQRLPDL